MKNILIALAFTVLASACSTKGTVPIEFKVKMCSNVLNKGATTQSTATTEAAICGDEVLVLRGQFNPTKSVNCDKGCAKTQYGDMALWNQFGQTIHFYCWVNVVSPGSSCFEKNFIDVRTQGVYNSTEGYHPKNDGIGETIVLDGATIYTRVCTLGGILGMQEDVCSEIQSFKMDDGQ